MGTRNLICVVHGGEFKVAQYSQWDGYPSGQGAGICEFLIKHRADLAPFIEQLSKLHWITEEEAEQVNSTRDWPKFFPWLSRDAGADILDHVLAGVSTGLVDSREFAGDSLFCEWAYVVDLDAEALEVYRGFNESGAATGRFAQIEGKHGYSPASLLCIIPFADITEQSPMEEVRAAGGDQ